MKKKIIKIVFVALMLSLSAYLSFEIYAQYKKRAMIAAEIAKVESIERSIDRAIVAPPPPSPPPPADGAPVPPPAPTIIHVSPTDGLRVELQETTSWNTILQLIFTLLATYLGVKLINRYVKE